MSDFDVIRTGENAQNASPAFDDLWLPIFGGEVKTRFDENLILKPLVDQMTLTTGTTMKWPRTWLFGAERHAAGAEMLGLDIDSGEIEVSIDSRPIVSHHTLDDIDAMMSHFEIRSKYAIEAGRSIAREVDKNVARLLLNTSRTSQPANGPFLGGGADGNGTAYIDANLVGDSVPSSTASRAACGALIKALDHFVLLCEDNDRNLPSEDRVCVVRPQLWVAMKVFGIPTVAAEMYGAGATAGPFWQQPGLTGPGGSMWPGRGVPLTYNGINIYMSPNVGNENVTTGPTKYQGDFSNTIGVIFQKTATVYLEMLGLRVATERSERRGADFFVVKHLGGGGAVRPEAAMEIGIA